MAALVVTSSAHIEVGQRFGASSTPTCYAAALFEVIDTIASQLIAQLDHESCFPGDS
jgi:hypothetical protein